MGSSWRCSSSSSTRAGETPRLPLKLFQCILHLLQRHCTCLPTQRRETCGPSFHRFLLVRMPNLPDFLEVLLIQTETIESDLLKLSQSHCQGICETFISPVHNTVPNSPTLKSHLNYIDVFKTL